MGSGLSDCEFHSCDGCGEGCWFDYEEEKGTRFCWTCKETAAAQLHMHYGGRKKIEPANDALIASMLRRAEGAKDASWEDTIALILRMKKQNEIN